MNDQERAELDALLWDLCDAQDTVTHELEAGRSIVIARKERSRVMDEIKRFVEEMSIQ